VPPLADNFARGSDQYRADARVQTLCRAIQGEFERATHRVFLLLVKRHNPEFLQ
jgi:hypothetical protein